MEATQVSPAAIVLDLGQPDQLTVRSGSDHRTHRRGSGLAKSSMIAADMVSVWIGTLAAAVVATGLAPYESSLAGRSTLLIGSLTLPLWIAIFSRYKLYTARWVSIRAAEFGRLVHAALVGTLMMAAVAFFTKSPVPRSWLIACFPTILLTTTAGRTIARAVFGHIRRSGRLVRRVVLVGANDEAAVILDLTEQNPDLGYRVVGVVDDDGVRHLSHHLVSGTVAETLRVVTATRATGVIIATTALTADSSNRLARDLLDAGVHVEMSSSLRDIDAERLVVRQMGPLSMMYVEPVRRGGWRATAKSTFDIVFSGVALLLAAPVLAALALAVMIDSKGGAFFSQTRVGKNGKPFSIYKFRTMVKDAETLLPGLQHRNEADGPLFKLTDDPRLTRLGRHLRRLSIDEIPQLWNVFLGQMSMVGPRPALYSEMAQWTPTLKATRLRVRPGLTGMWQVSGRSSLSFSDYSRLDLYYIDNWSLWRDLAIVAKTVPRVLGQRGAF